MFNSSAHVEDPESDKVALGPSRAGCFELLPGVATRLRMFIWDGTLSRFQRLSVTQASSRQPTTDHHIALKSPPRWSQSATPPTLLPAPITQPLNNSGNHSPTSVPRWPPTHPKARRKRPERTRSSSHLHSPSSAWPVPFAIRSGRHQ